MATQPPPSFPFPLPGIEAWIKHLPMILQGLRFLRALGKQFGEEDRMVRQTGAEANNRTTG